PPRPPLPTLFPYTTLFRSLTQQQEVAGVTALVERDGEPRRRGVAEERPDVHRAVEDRQVRVVVREDPAVVAPLRLRRDQLRELRSEEHTSELQSPDHLVCR